MLVLSRRIIATDDTRERRIMIGGDMILTLELVSRGACAVRIQSPGRNEMVVLKLNQAITVAPGVAVTLCAADRNSVRLGVAAPKNVRIDRKELLSYTEVAKIERAAGITPVPATA